MNRLDRVLDRRPLRHRDFRLLWAGTTAQLLGSRIAVVAVLVDVWELTHDPVRVGAIGLVTGVVTVVFGLAGGTLADAVDRRGLVLLTSAGAVVAAVLLATQAAAGLGSAGVVLALVGAQTACTALGSSARRAFVATLLPAGQVPAGVALNALSLQAATLVGPAVAGVVIARWGTGFAYGADAVLIAASLLGVARLPRRRASAPTARAGAGRDGSSRPGSVRWGTACGSCSGDPCCAVPSPPISPRPYSPCRSRCSRSSTRSASAATRARWACSCPRSRWAGSSRASRPVR